ncbi:MAG: hypothetical protein EBZ36_17560, partial [Acidobacteria bacterium]|nr:hypothetical protein [Acidobacteriota bacterium]
MKKHRWLAMAIFLCLLVTCVVPTRLAQVRPADRGAGGARPVRPPIRLVVGIVIDQFRYDYLLRFEDQFAPGGFRRFLNGGANFTDNHYLHTPTYTAPGHATFMSGTTPALNGIIGNEWYDRETSEEVSSVSDTEGAFFSSSWRIDRTMRAISSASTSVTSGTLV